MPYAQRFDGMPFRVPRNGFFKLRCCHCGLSHLLRTRTLSKTIELTAWQDARATSAARRGKKFVCRPRARK